LEIDDFSSDPAYEPAYKKALLSSRKWFPERADQYKPEHFGRDKEMIASRALVILEKIE
jgi:hypothetical protein